jgi:lipopolysaccharide exporter
MTRSVSASTGALIMVGLRWTDRLIGLVSTIILARLLVPEDFGIIAMAAIVVGLADVLLDMGVNVALIQNRNANQDDYNAAWTLRLIQSALAALLVFAAAEPAAEYFHDPRVAAVSQFLALSLLLTGCENIGVVTFQKNMEFGREFRFFFIKRMTGFLITISAAWLLHSYWAMVIGTLSGRAMGSVFSYVLHPMRPRPSLAAMKPMLSFSTWTLLRGIAGYLNQNLHRILVGRRESAAVMGAYSLGSDIAALPTTELLAPLNRVLFPLFVKLKHDLTRLKKAFLLALGIQALVGIPAGTGLLLVSNELVLALLGEKWIAAVPIVQIMGMFNIISSISASGGSMLLALGRAKVMASGAWTSVLLFAVLAMLAIPEGGAIAIAMLRVAVSASMFFLIFVYLIKRELRSLRMPEILASIWRPCFASAVMAVVLLALPSLDAIPVIARLLVKVSLGATVYTVCLLALWRLAACPDGAEAYLLEKLKLDQAMRRILRQPPR